MSLGCLLGAPGCSWVVAGCSLLRLGVSWVPLASLLVHSGLPNHLYQNTSFDIARLKFGIERLAAPPGGAWARYTKNVTFWEEEEEGGF